MPQTIIHTLNARDNVALEVARSIFKLTPAQMLVEIQGALAQTEHILREKGVSYQELKQCLTDSSAS